MLIRAALALAAFLLPSAAMACSCMRIAPEMIRQNADAIVVGRALDVTREGGINGMVTARIAVSKRIKGRVPRTVTVQTGGNGAMCGYRFTVGESREFLLSRREGRYSTNICLMMGARR